MKIFALAALAATALAAGPVLADGHTQGRIKAWSKVSQTPAGEKFGAIQATRIVGDKGRGNGVEPALGFDDHDPGVPGGNGGDPDAE